MGAGDKGEERVGSAGEEVGGLTTLADSWVVVFLSSAALPEVLT